MLKYTHKYSSRRRERIWAKEIFEEIMNSVKELSSRRAAWYSAATILQRSIALELDVDSLDIEIASVHKYHGQGDACGAELYLADDHPNGAGLVDWASRNWTALLAGCIDASGSHARLGMMIREECKRAVGSEGQVWRSPDILLRGFRNRQLHGLIEWRLGLELLRIMYDPAFVPGRDRFFEDWGLELPSWSALASGLADVYCSAYEKGKPVRRRGPGDVHGWTAIDVVAGHETLVLYLVSHPLWEAVITDSGPINPEVVVWARSLGVTLIHLVDSFNLSRRMAWVRGHLELFPKVDISTNREEGGGVLDSVPIDPWMQELISMQEGGVLVHDGWSWFRVARNDGWSAKPGIWLAYVNGRPAKVNISNYAGAGLRVKVIGSINLDRQACKTLPLIARRSEDRNS